jgi:hypothetical protein
MRAHLPLPHPGGLDRWPQLFHHAREAHASVEEQIEHLFHRSHGVVWELLDPACPHLPSDLPIRAADGTVVAYAHPDAAKRPGRPSRSWAPGGDPAHRPGPGARQPNAGRLAGR